MNNEYDNETVVRLICLFITAFAVIVSYCVKIEKEPKPKEQPVRTVEKVP